ncbi:hypothetical protein ASF62_06970 [Leifsonia sp. Leaf325]|nr:hypothetical protein [Leifsonia sp. Leaf325]KQQ93915.1 hypothetical protein ASF62_06970 [Leifsonia sp. Leaf325]
MTLPLLRPSIVAYNGYDSGLGNRVRVVLGCKSLADHENRDFSYVWPTGPLFGPKFPELWDFSGRTISRATSRVLAKVYPYVDETLTWLDDEKRREHVWQIRTGSPIKLPAGARSWQEEFRALQPADEIARAVTTFFDAHLRGAPYVGVMVRAHAVSHSVTRETSPVEWFITRMQQIRDADPDVRFFLSCDVPEVQERIIAMVPGCVAQTDKGAYNSAEAVRASIVDLYLLAASGYLIGPHFSSFIHLAEHLAGDRLILDTPVTPHAEPDYLRQGIVNDPLRPFVRVGQSGAVS